MTELYPNVRQREILQILMQAEWTPGPRLAPAGEGVLGNLVTKGWIERRLSDQGPACYRITEPGKQAYKIPTPSR